MLEENFQEKNLLSAVGDSGNCAPGQHVVLAAASLYDRDRHLSVPNCYTGGNGKRNRACGNGSAVAQ